MPRGEGRFVLLEPYSGHSPPPSFGGWPSAKQPRDLRLFDLAPCALAPPTRRWRGNLRVPGRARGRAATTLPPPRVFSSCRCSPPFCSLRRHAPAGVRPGSRSDGCPRSRRLTLPLPLLALGLRPPRASGRACPPSSPSSPPMRCPGSGLQRSRQLSASKPLRPALAIARGHGVSASGRRWRSCLRRHGNLLAYQVPRRGRLYPYKGTRGARIVSARRGE